MKKLEIGNQIRYRGQLYQIAEIYSQEWYEESGFIVEFKDTEGEWHNWKQAYDGGELLKPKYLTVDDLNLMIGVSLRTEDEEALQAWNNILDDVLDLQHTLEEDCAAIICRSCKRWTAAPLSYLVDAYDFNYICRSCQDEDDYTPPEYELDPARRFNEVVAAWDYDEYEDEDLFDEGDDYLDDYSQNMPCDNTEHCSGDSCSTYYTCQVHHTDKDE